MNDYIPFVFRCKDTQTSLPLYWRTGDFKTSLIEVGINETTGAIYCIKVPFFGSVEKIDTYWKSPTRNVIQGIPVCRINDWPVTDNYSDKFKDEPYAFRTIMGLDFVSFWLAPESELHSVYVFEQLVIGVDKNQAMQKIEFRNLSKADIERITPSPGVQ